jgi:hypothetical protein
MIGMISIREKRGIQWDRAQIMVPKTSKICFFLCGVILRAKEYYNVEMPKFLIGRNV